MEVIASMLFMPKNKNHIHPLRHQWKLLASLLFFLAITGHSSSQNTTIDSLNKLIKRYSTSNSLQEKDSVYVDALLSLGSAYRFKNQDSLRQLSEKSLQLSTQINYTAGRIKALNLLGGHSSDDGNSTTAISFFKQALKLAEKHDKSKIQVSILNNLGSEYSYQGNYARALERFLKAIDLAKLHNDQKMLSILNENIGNMYASQREYEQALEFYDIVKKINQSLNNEIFTAETLSNIASIYADMGDFDLAMFSINSSISVFEKREIYDWLAFAYSVKGEIYLKQKKYNWAIYWYEQCEILHKDLDDERATIDLNNGLAKAFLGIGEDEKARNYAYKGLESSKKINDLQGQRDCEETLYQVYKNGADYQQALTFHENYQKLHDSLSRNENQRSLNLLKTKFQYDQQKKALIADNDKALAKQRYIIFVTLAILLILLATSIPLYLNHKKQKQLNKELNLKTENLRDREAQLHEINNTKDKLFSIIGHDLRGPIGALQGILRLNASGDLPDKDFLNFVPKLKADVDHILFTLNNLLSWGYAQMNGTSTKPKVTCLNKVVAQNLKLLSEVANKKQIKILNQLPDNPLGYVDENHFDIIVRNLVSNAIKFTEENGLVSIECEEQHKFWQIIVRDTGIGMDESTQQKIFETQSTFTTYGTNNEKGTGLGLSLCKEMVEKNNGEIWVESVPKKGSTFNFTIPKVEKKYKKAG
ncbi:Multi-sensor signal transduction histidine kinase [Croceitalea dokdonensis DOKDO 023]|uniref:histidine kinase n=2 Tax=Croceitalea TaxID=574891 RepID=A0A0P7AY90_9FLAO|nr:Multi-sensor signal transduction histidine kinase [Croceitalea dokdonensis DOKDO 023]